MNERLEETSLSCTCDHQPWACQACDFGDSAALISDKEAVIRKRFRGGGGSSEAAEDSGGGEGGDNLATSDYDPGSGWLERDPETTQTFRRSLQVRGFC